MTFHGLLTEGKKAFEVTHTSPVFLPIDAAIHTCMKVKSNSI